MLKSGYIYNTETWGLYYCEPAQNVKPTFTFAVYEPGTKCVRHNWHAHTMNDLLDIIEKEAIPSMEKWMTILEQIEPNFFDAFISYCQLSLAGKNAESSPVSKDMLFSFYQEPNSSVDYLANATFKVAILDNNQVLYLHNVPVDYIKSLDPWPQVETLVKYVAGYITASIHNLHELYPKVIQGIKQWKENLSWNMTMFDERQQITTFLCDLNEIANEYTENREDTLQNLIWKMNEFSSKIAGDFLKR